VACDAQRRTARPTNLAAVQASVRVAHSSQHHLHLLQQPCRLPCCQCVLPACNQICVSRYRYTRRCLQEGERNWSSLTSDICSRSPAAADRCCKSAMCGYNFMGGMTLSKVKGKKVSAHMNDILSCGWTPCWCISQSTAATSSCWCCTSASAASSLHITQTSLCISLLTLFHCPE
jgi:hypothetical protein